MRTAWAPIIALAVYMSLPTVVLAQVTTADLVGRVTDTSGAVLPGVTVTVTQTGTAATRTQTTSETGDYAFTTLRPVPALTRIGGVLVQLVEIPGLIGGASEDRGGGRALLGVLRSADAIVYCCRATADPSELEVVRDEVVLAGIDKPSILAATQADNAGEAAVARLAAAFPELQVVPVSVLDEDSLEAFRQAVWALTGLIRVRLRKDGVVDEEPVALEPGSTVADVADAIHHDLGASFSGARVWGPSARFDGQRVGREHPVSDGDAVEILA